MKLSLLVLLACTLVFYCSHVGSVEVFIDSDTGAVLTERPERPAPWHSSSVDDVRCADSLDANYVQHSGRYVVNEWVYSIRDFEREGSIAMQASIYDLQEFAEYAHVLGAWHQPNTCQSSWDIMLHHIVQPMTHMIGKQQRGDRLSARDHGVAIDLMCKKSNMHEYEVCSAQEIKRMIHMAGKQKYHRTSDRPGGASPHV